MGWTFAEFEEHSIEILHYFHLRGLWLDYEKQRANTPDDDDEEELEL